MFDPMDVNEFINRKLYQGKRLLQDYTIIDDMMSQSFYDDFLKDLRDEIRNHR